jgi:integrase
LQSWPEQDRLLFLELQGDGDPLSGTVKSYKNSRTWKSREYSYSHWLGFLQVRHPVLLDRPPQNRVREDTARKYVDFLRASSNDVTIAIELQRLYLVIKDMAPVHNWRWLWLASQRLFKRAEVPPRRTVDATALYETGETLMRRAQQQVDDVGYLSEHAAKTYRKGLEIIVRIVIPERSRAWQGLRLGTSIKKSGPVWRIVLEEDDTKSGKRIPRRVPAQLWPWIDDYVERFRPALPGAHNHDGFWAASSGRPMSRSTVYQSITRTTKAELGKAVSPHEFRRAVATRWDRMAPDQPDKARRHLTHADHRITKKHYVVPSGYAGDGLIRAWERYTSRNERSRSAGARTRGGLLTPKGKDGSAS